MQSFQDNILKLKHYWSERGCIIQEPYDVEVGAGTSCPETFLRAFAQFLQRYPEARPKSRFLFYGNWLPEHNKFIEALNLADVVSLQVSVPYEQYLEKLKASPVLLLVVSSMHNFFMPSKIVDYFGAGRPILAEEHIGQGEFARLRIQSAPKR